MLHYEKLLGRAAYYRKMAMDSKCDRRAADMLELADLFMHMAYDVQAWETTRLRARPAPRRMSIQSAKRWATHCCRGVVQSLKPR